MPSVKFPAYVDETGDFPNLQTSLRVVEKGLQFGTYTPTLANITAPATGNLRGIWQLCGRVCFVDVIFDYTGSGAGMAITASNTMSLPFKVSSRTYNISESPLSLVTVSAAPPAFISYGTFQTSTGNTVTFPTRAKVNNEITHVYGFYWVD